MSLLLKLLVALIVFVLSIVLGRTLARWLRMPDHGWRLGLIFFTLLASTAIILLGWPPKLGVDLKGGVKLIYEVDQASKEPGTTVDMDKLVAAVTKRINPGGQKEVTVRKYGFEQIEVIVPDVQQNEVDQLKAVLGQAGNLEFRILASRHFDQALIERAEKLKADRIYDASERVIARWVPIHLSDDEAAENAKSEQAPKMKLAYNPSEDDAFRTRNVRGKLRTEVLVKMDPPQRSVTGLYLQNSAMGVDPKSGLPDVEFSFNATGAAKFYDLTSQNMPDEVQRSFEHRLGIVLDDEIWTAPNLHDAISDRGVITFGQRQSSERLRAEVNMIVEVLNAGALPAALSHEPLSETYSGPTLGSDTIQKATYAMIVASILVPLFMLWYYRFAGIVANLALILNMLMLLAIMISINADFTLTGFAGLALTVGMAVDNNVLVFERLREEMERGATLRMAIRNAFHRVSATIIDCNLTHLLAAAVFYFRGSDQLKGFAVTLFFGCAISIYTSVFVAHVVFGIAERRGWLTRLKMLHMIRHTKIDFMGWFPVAATASVLVTVLGLLIAGARQRSLFDIDFTGGTSVQVEFRQAESAGEVRKALAHLPDVAIADVRFQNEPAGKRYEINTSDQDINEVKQQLRKVFGDRLETNTVKLGSAGITTITPESLAGEKAADGAASTVSPGQPSGAGAPAPEVRAAPQAGKPAEKNPAPKTGTQQPAPKTAEKPAAKSAPAGAKPATNKSSRNDLPPDNVLALADEAPLLLSLVAQGAESPAKPEAGTGEQEAGNKSKAAAEKAPAKPTAEKPVAPATKEAIPGNVSGESFVGGSSVELSFGHAVNHQAVADMVADALKANQLSADTISYDVTNPEYASDQGSKAYPTWQVKIQLSKDQAQKVLATLQEQVKYAPFFPAATQIGSAVAGNTRTDAVWALIASWCLIILYLWIRFQRVAFGVAAVIALIHDVLVMLGAVAASYWLAKIPFVQDVLLIDQFKINLPIVAAFLTIIGYSVNDTIVVFDRIREVRGKDPSMTRKMINDSTNQTLSRTLLTSFTVFLVVVVLYFFGGQALRGFSFALIVGVATGTYSSIYVAAPILLWMIGTPEKKGVGDTEQGAGKRGQGTGNRG